MRVKRFGHLLQVRISDSDKSRLAETAAQLEMDQSTLARLSIRAGLSQINQPNPHVEHIRFSLDEVVASQNTRQLP